MKRTYILSAISLLISGMVSANPLGTNEGSADTSASEANSKTVVGGYGNAFYSYDSNEESAKINLERFVLFFGHKFNSQFSLFSELEVEDAKVAGGEEGGEVALEQCYIQYNVNNNNYFKFGLFLPKIGILNTNHLPTEYLDNERTIIETQLIPSTWRELGVSFNGSLYSVPFNYSVALVNGLNCESFEHGNVIRDGRYEGSNASGNNLAITGAVDYSIAGFKFQASGYYGGSVGLAKKEADLIGIEGGIFGTPVSLGEFDITYRYKRFEFKALAAVVSIKDAETINKVYDNNTPESAFGVYAEAAYALHESENLNKPQRLMLFGRFEKLNLNAGIPDNGIEDKTLDQQHIIFGLSYQPIQNVIFKADAHLSSTGEQNPLLLDDPSAAALYKKTNTFINLGFGYSF